MAERHVRVRMHVLFEHMPVAVIISNVLASGADWDHALQHSNLVKRLVQLIDQSLLLFLKTNAVGLVVQQNDVSIGTISRTNRGCVHIVVAILD